MADLAWRDRAACLGAHTADSDDIFFNLRSGVTPTAALTVCRACPVRPECLAWATANLTAIDDYGVWGGTTPAARAHIRTGRTTPQDAMRHADLQADRAATAAAAAAEREPWLHSEVA